MVSPYFDASTAAMVLIQKVYQVSLLSSDFFINNFLGFWFRLFFLEKTAIYFAFVLSLNVLLKNQFVLSKLKELIDISYLILSFWTVQVGKIYKIFFLSVFN